MNCYLLLMDLWLPADDKPMNVTGVFTADSIKNDYDKTVQQAYMVNNLKRQLVGKPAIKVLKILRSVDVGARSSQRLCPHQSSPKKMHLARTSLPRQQASTTPPTSDCCPNATDHLVTPHSPICAEQQPGAVLVNEF